MAVSRVSTSSILQGFPKSRSLLSGNPAFIPSNFYSLATTLVGSGGASTITFSSIPSGYRHLQIRSNAKSTGSGDAVRITFNSDTGSNYANHYLYSNGSTTYAGGETSGARINVYAFYASNSVSGVFGPAVLDILDYTNTNKNKTTRSLSGFDQNSAGNLGLQSGLWMNTNAITSITLAPQAGDWAQYSRFTLYGVR